MLREPHLGLASARPEADRCAAAAAQCRPREVSSAAFQPPEAVSPFRPREAALSVLPDVAVASSESCFRQGAFRREVLRSEAQLSTARSESAEPTSKAAFPAAAWRRAAFPSDALLVVPSDVRLAASPAQPVSWVPQAPSLPPEVAAVGCEQVVPRSAQPAEGSRAVLPWAAAASDAGVAQPQAVAALGAAAGPPQGAAAVARAAVAEPRQVAVAVAWAAVAELRQVAVASGAVAELPLVAAELGVWARQRAAGRPSAAPSAFRRGLTLPSAPGRQRAARSAHAMRRLRAASPSERSWQAARCEGLS